MLKSEPFEFLENAFDELRAAAARVEILNPQQEPAAAGPGAGMAERRRIGVPQMEPAGGRGGETCDLQDSLHGKADSGDS